MDSFPPRRLGSPSMSSVGPDFRQRQKVLFLSKTSCPAEKMRKAGDHTHTLHLLECNKKLPRSPKGRSKLRRTELPARHLPSTKRHGEPRSRQARQGHSSAISAGSRPLSPGPPPAPADTKGLQLRHSERLHTRGMAEVQVGGDSPWLSTTVR